MERIGGVTAVEKATGYDPMAWSAGEVTTLVGAVTAAVLGVGAIYKSRIEITGLKLQLKKSDEEAARRAAEEIAKIEAHKSDIIFKLQESASAWIVKQEEANEKLRVEYARLLAESNVAIKQATEATELSHKCNQENRMALHALATKMREAQELENILMNKDQQLAEEKLINAGLAKANVALEAARVAVEYSLRDVANAATGANDGTNTQRFSE